MFKKVIIILVGIKIISLTNKIKLLMILRYYLNSQLFNNRLQFHILAYILGY